MSTLVRQPATSAPPLLTGVEGIVARVRGAWRRSVLLCALVVAPALFALAAVLLVAADLLLPMRAAVREVLRWLPLALGLGWIALSIYRVLRPPAPRRFALLAEERIPALENRLVTALDVREVPDGPVGRAFAAEAERRLAGVAVRGVAPVRAKAPAIVLAASLTLAAAFALAFPSAAAEAWERWAHPRDAYETRWREVRANTLPGAEAPPMPVFEELRWRVAPPGYAGIGATEGRGEEQVSALPGSRVRLRSAYFDRWDAVRATRIGGGALPVSVDGGEWSVEWTQAPGERGVSLEAVAGGEVVARRVVPVAVLPDRAPDVELSAPETDLVLASGKGRVPIRATAADDYGMGEFKLSWSRTRGSGETFEFLEGEWRFESVRRAGKGVTGELALNLDALQLQPGDVIHVRAVAADRNDVTGPGESVSRTRILRVARPEEISQVNTDIGLPMELPEDPLLSQRMLILLTERLIQQRRRLPDEQFRERSSDLAFEQGRLRERVGEQIFTRATGAMADPGVERGFTEQGGAGHQHEGEQRPAEGEKESPERVLEEASEATGEGSLEEVTHRHDADPILDVNSTLLRLYNLMWDAERELNQAVPDAALPPMRRALVIIDELRKAERRFPRGQVKIDPVDVATARGQGKLDEAAPVGRGAGAALPSPLPLLAALDRLAASLGRTPARRASLELSALAARVLGDSAGDAEAASLVSRAAGEAGAGRADAARGLLLRARGRLAPVGGAGGRPVPSTADPAAAEYFRRLGRGG
ncbi:MAG TPA: hypothetical protein VF746_29345 [Longimicrobium sp.]